MKNFSIENWIVFEDENLMVINKPPYISTLEDRNSTENILQFARQYTSQAQVCHRLDKETSGALIVSKNTDTYKFISLQFENRTVKKIYHAICDGIHQIDDVLIQAPIHVTGAGQPRIDFREGKKAETYARTRTVFSKHTLVECFPKTGRMHQIRLHLSYMQAPISGDALYGGKPIMLSEIKKKYNLKKWTDELPIIQRIALHAHSLEFELFSQEKIIVEAPYPKDFNAAIQQLTKFSN